VDDALSLLPEKHSETQHLLGVVVEGASTKKQGEVPSALEHGERIARRRHVDYDVVVAFALEPDFSEEYELVKPWCGFREIANDLILEEDLGEPRDSNFHPDILFKSTGCFDVHMEEGRRNFPEFTFREKRVLESRPEDFFSTRCQRFGDRLRDECLPDASFSSYENEVSREDRAKWVKIG
jgi:hypothetical protein